MSSVVQHYEDGTEMTGDAFRARMEDQCQKIEQYRLAVKRDGGRSLTLDEAALEWIERYAEAFDHGANPPLISR